MRDFVRGYLAERSRRRKAADAPFSLWVHGDAGLRAEFLAALHRSKPQLAQFAAAQELEHCGHRGEHRTVDISRLERFGRAALLAIELEVADLREGIVHAFVDAVVDKRYSERRSTIVLSSLDAGAAYDAWVPGVDAIAMPRIVGRILEHGDSVGLDADGAHLGERVFSHRGTGDFRLQILRENVGRVAMEKRAKWR